MNKTSYPIIERGVKVEEELVGIPVLPGADAGPSPRSPDEPRITGWSLTSTDAYGVKFTVSGPASVGAPSLEAFGEGIHAMIDAMRRHASKAYGEGV